MLLIVLSVKQIQVRLFLNQFETEKESGIFIINNASIESTANSRAYGVRSETGLNKKYYYRPAETEKFVIKHLNELGLNETDHRKSKGCTTFLQHDDNKNPLLSNHVISKFTNYVQDLTTNFTHHKRTFDSVHDIMKTIKKSSQEDIQNICKSLRPHNHYSIDNIFGHSELSYSSRMGYMEPLLPPMRHPIFCKDKEYVVSLDYLVHDFEAMCNALKPYSKLIMIDMGAGM